MPSTMRSLRQEQRHLSSKLRAEHKTWAEVAAVFCERYHLNMRAALRMVRDWSQRDAAEHWNSRWPADPKTFKNFSYWELWPSPTGHAPSLDVLTKLAELYECRMADLIVDCGDFRGRDSAYRDASMLVGVSLLDSPVSKSDETSPSRSSFSGLLARLEAVDVTELARILTVWTGQVSSKDSRRALLLKLSAGLSMAALSQDDSDESRTAGNVQVLSESTLSGIWHSRYIYTSTARGCDFTGEHYVVLRQQGDRVLGQGLPHSIGSRLRLELALHPPVATGSWCETTSPTGYYKGATYHGCLQMVIDPSGRSMRGMWLGFSRDFQINSGRWELTLMENSTEKTVQRSYHMRA